MGGLRDTPIIATRELQAEGSGRKRMVTIWQPQRLNELDWVCAYRVTGMRRPKRAIGGDAVQALIDALMGIRSALNETPGRYTWLGGNPGEHGIPQIVPDGFGPRWDAHIERVIDRELTKFVEAELRRRRRRGGKS